MYDLLVKMVEHIFGMDLITSVQDNLIITCVDDVLDTIQPLYDSIFIPFAMTLLAIFACMAVFDRQAHELASPETLLQIFIRFFISIIIVASALDLVSLFINIGNALLQDIINSMNSSDTPDYTEKIMEVLETLGVEKSSEFSFSGIIKSFKSFGVVLVMILPWLFSCITSLYIDIQAFTRMLEIHVRAIYFPIAIADSYNGMSSNAARYIKRFAGVCLQGALIIVILIVGSAISVTTMEKITTEGVSDIDGILKLVAPAIVIKGAQLYLVKKSENLAFEICGA